MIDSRPVDGPRWVPDAVDWITTQTDGRGVTWMCVRIEQGGRVLHGRSAGDNREARTEATPAHPKYPSDAEVLAADRSARKAAVARGFHP